MSDKQHLENVRIYFNDIPAMYTGDADYGFFGSLKPDGRGMAVLSNGDIFEGRFSKGKPLKGRYTFENGSYYYVNYLLDEDRRYFGYGFREPTNVVEINSYDSNYVGEVKNGKPDGIGKMRYENSRCFGWVTSYSYYEGGFKQGKKHGVGKFTTQDGDCEVCVYNDGKELFCIEYCSQEKSQTTNSYEKPTYRYSDDFKQTKKELFLKYYNNGEYDKARSILRDLDSDEMIGTTSFHSTAKSAREWEEELDNLN